MANECLDSRMKSGISGVLCKLDLEKAINWEFLSYLLGHLGLGSKWRKLISACISTAHFLILINDNPHGFFASSRGLHQGDPLLPIIFVIVMEALSRILSRATIGGYLSRFWVDLHNANPLEISHLFFADDSLIMCDVDRDQTLNLGHILLCFEAISSLKIILWKSE